VELTCPHCKRVNLVAGFVPRDPDKPNSQGREEDVIYCGWCGGKFTPKLPPQGKS
jgi:transcription elongation factor Elf1